jgi:hypothetical protein
MTVTRGMAACWVAARVLAAAVLRIVLEIRASGAARLPAVSRCSSIDANSRWISELSVVWRSTFPWAAPESLVGRGHAWDSRLVGPAMDTGSKNRAVGALAAPRR